MAGWSLGDLGGLDWTMRPLFLGRFFDGGSGIM